MRVHESRDRPESAAVDDRRDSPKGTRRSRTRAANPAAFDDDDRVGHRRPAGPVDQRDSTDRPLVQGRVLGLKGSRRYDDRPDSQHTGGVKSPPAWATTWGFGQQGHGWLGGLVEGRRPHGNGAEAGREQTSTGG